MVTRGRPEIENVSRKAGLGAAADPVVARLARVEAYCFLQVLRPLGNVLKLGCQVVVLFLSQVAAQKEEAVQQALVVDRLVGRTAVKAGP